MKRLSRTPPVWDSHRLRIATDAAGIALWSWNVDTNQIELDEKAHQIWGLPEVDGFVTFESLSAQIHPEDLDRVRAAFTATRDIFGGYEIDFRIMDGHTVRWVSARGRGEDEGIVGRVMYGVFLDISERKSAEDAREMLAGEMSHRVKNLFAIASALTDVSARSAASVQDMRADLKTRLIALGQAHNLARPFLDEQKKAAPLRNLLSVLLAAYDTRDAAEERIRIDAPELLVGERSITTLALVVHELATNAVKYGALSSAAGSLDISCSVDAGHVVLIWTETGGPPVQKEQGAPGFGSKLVTKCITDQLGGRIGFEWPSEGLIATLRVSRMRLEA